MPIPLCFLTIVARKGDVTRDYPGSPLWVALCLNGEATHGS